MSAPRCTVTITERRHPCKLPQGHEGRHEGLDTDWVWWHGNGEECGPECDYCARTKDQPLPIEATS
jgi:hypothetical protein